MNQFQITMTPFDDGYRVVVRHPLHGVRECWTVGGRSDAREEARLLIAEMKGRPRVYQSLPERSATRKLLADDKGSV
jgi:hypothetical protein